MQIVDLFCGIGGVAEAARQLPTSTQVVAAIDIDLRAGAVYSATHGISPSCQTLESIGELPDADLWWLSPPCQPYTSRGRGRAESDPRSQALTNLIKLIHRDQPALVALENVPQFADSFHHRQLMQVFDESGYSFRVDLLCPTEFGIPMRRRRYYLRARRDGEPIATLTKHDATRRLTEFLDDAAWDDDRLRVSSTFLRQYSEAARVINLDDRSAIASCFTSAYGNSPVHAGSYLHCADRALYRRFSPDEIARLMGFSNDLQWPDGTDLRTQYHLTGNSLSVTVVKALLKGLAPES